MLTSVPKTLFDLANAYRKNDVAAIFTLKSLKQVFVGGQAAPLELLRHVMQSLTMVDVIHVGFGMTEVLGTHSMVYSRADMNDTANDMCIGKLAPLLECKIVEPATGQTAPLNESGEAWIRGYTVTQGYWDEPDKSSQAIDKYGWFKTGDIMRMNADGKFFYVNRIKDIIYTGGTKIFPSEVESILRKHPKILDVCIFGIADKSNLVEEAVCAWIIPIMGTVNEQLTPDDVRGFCADKMNAFKIPKHVKIVDDFPMSGTQKVDKMKMAKMYKQELNL